MILIICHSCCISSNLTNQIALMFFTDIYFSALQVACVRTAFLPGCTTSPGGWGVLKPSSLGGGTALCGVITSTQNSKCHF